MNVADAEVVAQAIAAGVGHEVTVSVGGKPRSVFKPVRSRGRTLNSVGEFIFKGRYQGRDELYGALWCFSKGDSLVGWTPVRSGIRNYTDTGPGTPEARIVRLKSAMALRAPTAPSLTRCHLRLRGRSSPRSSAA